MLGDLTTLVNVKSYIGSLQDSTASDDLLNLLITLVSDEIKSFINRDIYPVASYAEVRDGNGRTTLNVLQYPITAVSGVVINGTAIPAITTRGGAGYAFDKNSIRLSGYAFTPGVQNVSVAYSAGYAAPPPALELACIQLVAARYEGRNRIGVQGRSLGQEHTSFETGAMPEAVRQTLNQWRRVVPG